MLGGGRRGILTGMGECHSLNVGYDGARHGALKLRGVSVSIYDAWRPYGAARHGLTGIPGATMPT